MIGRKVEGANGDLRERLGVIPAAGVDRLPDRFHPTARYTRHRKLGAEPKSEWTVFRLTHDGIARLAQSESVAKEP